MSLSEFEARWTKGRARQRWPLLALLAAAHIALLGQLASQLQTQRQAKANKARPLWSSLTLWLRPPPVKAVAKPAEPPRPVPRIAAPDPARQDLAPTATSTAPLAEAATPAATEAAPGPPSAKPATGNEAEGTRAPLRLTLPKSGKPGEFTQFHNPALHDPRSNTRIRLTMEEKMAIALGSVECILEERQPDGSIWRGAGRKLTVAPAIAATGAAAAGSDPKANVTLCVR